MAGPCLPMYRKEKVEKMTKEEKKLRAEIEVVYKDFRNSDLVRFALRASEVNGVDRAFVDWVQLQTGRDIKAHETLTQGDMNDLKRDMLIAKKQVKAMKEGKIGTEVGMAAFAKKWLFLPVSVWSNLPGGRDVFMETSQADLEMNSRLDHLSAGVAGLEKRMTDIAGTSAMEESKVIGKLEAELLTARVEHKQKKKDKSPDVGKAATKVENIKRKLDARMGLQSNTAALLMKDLAKTLNGEGRTIHELKKDYDNVKDVEGLFSQAREFLDGYKAIAAEATADAQFNLMQTLIQKGVSASKAKEIAEESIKFEEVDEYYPRKSLMQIGGIMTSLARVRDAKDSTSAVKEANDAISAYRSSHTMDRSANDPQSIRMNSLAVLNAYGAEMVKFGYNNKVARQLNTYLHDLMHLRSTRNAKHSDKDLYKSIEGVRRIAQAYQAQMLDVRSRSTLDEVISASVALQAMKYMGGNPTTVANNLVDGFFQMKAQQWFALGKSSDREHEHQDAVNRIMGKAFTKFKPEQTFDSGMENELSEVRKLLDPEVYEAITGTQKDTKLLKAEVIRRKISDVASKSLFMNTGAENILRKKAYKIGVTEAYDFFHKTFYPSFVKGTVNLEVRKRFGITKEMLVNEESGKRAFEKAAEKYAINEGFKGLAETQSQYNMGARGHIDGTRMRAFTVFTHWGRNTFATFGHKVGLLRNYVQANGAGALLKNPSKYDTKIPFNREALYLTTLGVGSMMRQVLRNKLGLTLFYAGTHPVGEALLGLAHWAGAILSEEDTEKAKKVMYSESMAEQFAGPLFGEVMDAVNYGYTRSALEDGTLNEHMNEIIRFGTGMNFDQSPYRADAPETAELVKHVIAEASPTVFKKGAGLMDAVNNGWFSSWLTGMVGIRQRPVEAGDGKRPAGDKART